MINNFNNVLGFKKAGVFDVEQQNIIINEKLKDLYIMHEIEEFVHIGKESIPNII